ncbi:glycosyltransferase family 2 protein [Flavobacterium frigoris]|uniref:N-acetylglucosaminyltransferase n=1 Tax=Flavobacterium frigoris (strain PS1) TaxID=1086011 RepID=H7FP75_FLAFP|nr:glycosyltransferase [Flavobacterium frigoris]EIA09555.1 N-acetylglucosaminyltransferase [Flavobacterium frigoris PS1]
MMLFLIIISSIYFFVIGFLILGFSKIKNFESIDLQPKTQFSIIVPFRNEAENLPILLDSFSKLNYPMELINVILVDDESKEKFKVQSLKFKVRIIDNTRLTNSPKKDAIVSAMNVVNTDWVITTDADCLVNANWLLTIDNYIQSHEHEVAMIAGAVTYDCSNSFLHQFQQLDLASLQGATIGSFGIRKGFMCNGANLAYTKTLFQELNGFDGNDNIASGDDVFLLQKAILRFREQVHYLKSKNNIVTSKPLNDWKSLFYQRVRWASKTTSYQSSFGKFLGVAVLMGNLCWILAVGFWIFRIIPIELVIILSLLKFTVDALFIFKTNTFLGQKNRYLILSSLLYPFFSVCVAFYSLFGKYEWKGRKFRL